MIAKLEELLSMNGINSEEAEEKLYSTLVIGVFAAICSDIDKEGKQKRITERTLFRNAINPIAGAKQIIKRYTGCVFSETEYSRLADLFCAYFQKDNDREEESESYKKMLLEKQKNCCAICKAPLTNPHLDHIVPFKYVGNQLPNNYQMLCETCNTRKGKSVIFELSMLMLRRKK